MYRGSRIVKPIEIFKEAIRRAVLIMRVMSQNSECPDIVALLQDIMQKQRQGMIIEEDDL